MGCRGGAPTARVLRSKTTKCALLPIQVSNDNLPAPLLHHPGVRDTVALSNLAHILHETH